MGADISLSAFLPALITFVVSWVLTRWLVQMRGGIQALDTPNDRSLHVKPVPRSGGLAIMAGLLAGLLCLWLLKLPLVFGWLEGGAFLLLLLISFVDDHRSLPALPRLAAMAVVSAFVLQVQGEFLLSSWSGWLAFGFLLWCINLYNFMDGMDGLAVGMTLIGFAVIAYLAWGAGYEALALFCGLVITAALGFLCFNFPPARIFMGDVGSVPLGFLSGWLMLYAHALNILPIWLGMLVFSPFLVDASLTLLRRVARRERFWEAHRSHYYQRLVLLGWSQRRVLLYEYLLMLACGLSVIWAAGLSMVQQFLIIGGWILVYSSLVLLIGRMEVHS